MSLSYALNIIKTFYSYIKHRRYLITEVTIRKNKRKYNPWTQNRVDEMWDGLIERWWTGGWAGRVDGTMNGQWQSLCQIYVNFMQIFGPPPPPFEQYLENAKSVSSPIGLQQVYRSCLHLTVEPSFAAFSEDIILLSRGLTAPPCIHQCRYFDWFLPHSLCLILKSSSVTLKVAVSNPRIALKSTRLNCQLLLCFDTTTKQQPIFVANKK